MMDSTIPGSNDFEVERESIGEAPFSVSARVAMQLGRESISNSIVAILELVKNAYDADSENVVLFFGDLDKENPILIIDDDGSGMNYDQLVNNWMKIGTNNKLLNQTSTKKGRVLIGEKGLGRLGLDRLCQITNLQTFPPGETSGIELIVDWRKYEGTDERLEEITHELYRLNSRFLLDPVLGEYAEKAHGTRLILSGLKDRWTDEDLNRLRGELSLLISPFAGINDFSISLYGRSLGEKVGSVEMLQAAEWRLDATVNEKGMLEYVMTARGGAKFTFNDQWAKRLNPQATLPRCGPLEFIMYFIPRQSIEELSLDLAQIKEFLDANQGIRIYRDRFRVKPYGDPSGEGDWLNLSFRRQQHPGGRASRSPWRVGYNQVVGAVFLEKEKNTALIDQTNREGIVEGDGYYDLKRFALDAIEWFEQKAQEYERAQSRRTHFEKAQEEAEALAKAAKDAIEALESRVTGLIESTAAPEANEIVALRGSLAESVVLLKKTVEELRDAQDEMGKASEEERLVLEQEKDTLGNLASLGILTVAFGHETLGYSNLVMHNTTLLSENIRSLLPHALPEVRTEIGVNINDLHYGASRINTFANFALRNVRRDKRERIAVYLDKVIKEVFATFELPSTREIAVEYDFPRSVPPILAFRIDWESIIINLITNAIWAIQHSNNAERKIRVRLQMKDNELILSFADSGHGILAGTKDRIFEPTFSTKRNERGDKVGTGMGLAIVDNLVRSYGGVINIESPSDLKGAQFHIRVPIPKIANRGKRKQ